MQRALSSFQKDLTSIYKVSEWLLTPPALAIGMDPALSIRCGSIVLLSGYLESFLRECMQRFIEEVNVLGKPLSSLPDDLIITHFQNGALALTNELKRAKRRASGASQVDTTSCADLAARLGSVNLQTGYSLAWEAFSDTKANPGPEVVKGLLSAVGIEGVWPKINGKVPPGIRLEVFLTSFIAMRNECAHSGAMSSPPTPSELQDYVVTLFYLAASIVLILEERLAEISALPA